MSDFFGRLLQRERSAPDPARVVPRLPSLFEPAAGAAPGGWPASAGGLDERSAEAPHHHVPGPPPGSLAPVARDIRLGRDVDGVPGREDHEAAAPAPGAGERARATPGRRSTPVTAEEESGSGPAGPPAGSRSEPPAPSTRAFDVPATQDGGRPTDATGPSGGPVRSRTLAPPSVVPRTATRTGRSGRGEAPAGPAHEQADARPGEPSARDAGTAEPERTPVSAPAPPPRVGVLSAPPPLHTLSVPRGPAGPGASEAGGAETERTVHVTIGRVEIRAVPAPPVAPRRTRSQAQPEPTSLDAYLAQRNGGRRS